MALSCQEVDLLRTFADLWHLLEIRQSTGEPIDLQAEEERVHEAIIAVQHYSCYSIQRIAEGQLDLDPVRVKFTLVLFRSHSC